MNRNFLNFPKEKLIPLIILIILIIAITQNIPQQNTPLEPNKESATIFTDEIKESKNEDVKNIIEKANQGDVIAELTVGLMYFCNDSIPRNHLDYFSAIGSSFSPLQCKTYAYENTTTSTKRYENALKYITSASDKENDYANLLLGYFFQYGYGVDKNEELAIAFFKKSAEQGNALSQRALGDIYLIKPNGETESLKYYTLCAEKGNSECQHMLGNSFYQKEKYSDALKWYSISAQNGDISSQNSLAGMYFRGNGVVKNMQESANLFKKSADKGNLYAEYIIGLMYFKGDGFPKNHQKASEYFSRVSEELEKSYSESKYQYESIKENPSLLEENPSILEQYKYYMQGAKGFSMQTRKTLFIDDYSPYPYEIVIPEFYLGIIYLKGEGVLQNYEQSAKWFRTASSLEDITSQYNLALMYLKGMGVNKNLVLAHMWSNIASVSGEIKASKLRDDIENQMSPEEINDAQNLAVKCKSSSFLECE